MMESCTKTHCGRGIEYYHQLKHTFHPLWPVSDHSTKMIDFYQFCCHPKTSVDTYTATFKWWVLEMNYNGITFNPDRLGLQLINGLGNGFTHLRNMPMLPPEWQTTNTTLLTHTSRTYLSTLDVNYEMNRSQLAYLKTASTELRPEKPPEHSRQYPRQQTPGTPNPLTLAPIHPSPIIPPPTP